MDTIRRSRSGSPGTHLALLLHLRRRVQRPIALAALLLALIGLSGAVWAQALQATLDRTEVTLGESVTLTLEIATASPAGDPGWENLTDDFEITHPRRSTRHVVRNGTAASSTQWQVTLLPRRAGTLTIPPLHVGTEATAPLTLHVLPARAAPTAGEPIFLETTVDRDSVYVEQQLLLTVRVHHAIPLDDMRLAEPEFDHATIHKVDQTTYSREIEGISYRVHELRYAIFPRQAGQLVIPELAFTASQLVRSRSLFDFPGQGKPVSALSSQVTVAVKPVPAAFTGPVWLPARNLTLMESWNQSPQQLRTGESITRTLTLRADGLAADRLPPLPQPDLERARLYADQPQLDNTMDPEGVHGSRIESAALIAREPGTITLPGLRVIWWDIESDTQRVAEIPSQQLQATPGSTSKPAPSPATGQPALDSTAAESATDAPADADASTAAPQAGGWSLPAWPWLIALALALIGWLATLVMYGRLRRQLTTSGPRAAAASSDEEEVLFNELLRLCKDNQPEAARRALLRWARHYFRDPALHSTAALRQRLAHESARDALDQLDAVAFGTLPAAWRGDEFAQVISQERRRSRAADSRGTLPPLYPSKQASA